MTQHNLVKLVTLLFLFNGNIVTALANEHILIPNFGVVTRNDNTNHRVDNDSFDLDNGSVAGFGFKYLYQLDNGLSFGAELLAYENDIVATSNNSGDIRTSHVYGVIQKTFNLESSVKPFVGLGLGVASVTLDANINGAIDDDYEDYAAGFSYEIFVGAEIAISEKIGLTVEYKYFDFDINDDIGNRDINIESDGQALWLGVAIHL